MTKLSDIQAVILSAAAQRDDGAVLPLPETLKIRGGAVDKVLGSLKAKGLIDRRGAGRGDNPVSRPSVSSRSSGARVRPTLRRPPPTPAAPRRRRKASAPRAARRGTRGPRLTRRGRDAPPPSRR